MHVSHNVLSFNNYGFQAKSSNCYWFNIDSITIGLNSKGLSIN